MNEETITMKDMCELVARWFKEKYGKEVTPQEIYNSSPTGELFQVGEWYWQARAYYHMHTAERLPEKAVWGQIEIVPDGKGSSIAFMYNPNGGWWPIYFA